MRALRNVVSFLFLMSMARPGLASITCDDIAKAIAKAPTAKKLKTFFDMQWKYDMTTFPEWATYVGYPGQNDRWTDMSLPAIEAHKKMNVCQLKALESLSPKLMPEADKLNLKLALRSLKLSIELDQFPNDFLVINQLSGLQSSLPDMLFAMPKETELDFQNMIARLKQTPTLVEQTKVLMTEGLRLHVTAVKMFLEKVPAQFDQVLTTNIEESPLYAPFKVIDAHLPADRKLAIQAEAKTVIEKEVYPELKKLKAFLVNEYIPQAHEFTSWGQMPNGVKWYELLVKIHTTTDQTPQQLHELGLSEVARIRREMEKVKDQAKFKGSLKDFNKFLLSDPKFFYTKKEDLVAGYRDIAKRIDAVLPRLFKKLPRLTYGVRAVPEYKEQASSAAYYEGGTVDGGRAGYFNANTFDLKTRPKWVMEALTLHEAVPGHHLQLALSQELENQPEIRKYDDQTAFVEGWGLYAEWLGEELGMYKDPYSKYGELSFEMLRAARLVADTGLHYKAWTREQAIQYFLDNVPQSRLETEVEIDRYITWPGQALAYKVGQLKFKALRARAEAQLRKNFDVRAFHDEILSHGSLPLDTLESQFELWLSRQKKTPSI